MKGSGDSRLEVSPDRRIGNPRPLGRLLPVIPASGHGVVSDVRTRILMGRNPNDDGTPDPPPFFPVVILDLGGNYEVTLQPGVVASWSPIADTDTLELVTPEVNGQPIDADPRPTIVVPPGEWVSMEIDTDAFNQITGTPKVVVADQDGTHYIPEVADTEPRDGKYYVKLFKITVVDDRPVVTSGVQSDILLTPYLWPGENEGGGARVLKDYDVETGAYRFRTIADGYGVSTLENGDEIQPSFNGENVGTGVDTYKTPENAQPGDAAQFRRLGGRSSDDSGCTKQIQTRQAPADPNSNEVIGNGKLGTITFTKNGVVAGTLTFDDGLWTNDGNLTIEVCCTPSSTEAPGP